MYTHFGVHLPFFLLAHRGNKKLAYYGKIISMVESNSMSVLEMELIKIA